jgi:hypothetical protein
LRGAKNLVERYGVALVNEALEQMEGNSELKNPAAFLVWLVRQLAQEVPQADSREKSVRPYQQRSGHPQQEVPHGDH